MNIVAELQRLAEEITAADPIEGLGEAGLLPGQHRVNDKKTEYDPVRQVRQDSGFNTIDTTYRYMDNVFPESAMNTTQHSVGNNNESEENFKSTDAAKAEKEALYLKETDKQYQEALGQLTGFLDVFVKSATKMSVYLEQELAEARLLDGDIKELPEWLLEEDHDTFARASELHLFTELAKTLNYYLSFIDFGVNEGQRIVFQIGKVAVRFTQVKSKARPGVLEALRGMMTEIKDDESVDVDVDDKIRKIPSTMNVDRALNAQLAREYADKLQRRVAKIKAIIAKIHEVREANVEAGTGTKEYLKNFFMLMRQKNDQLVEYAFKALGMPIGRRPYIKLKTSSVKTAGVLGDLWDKVKSKISDFGNWVKGKFEELKHWALGIKDVNQLNAELLADLEALADELEQDI